MTQIEEQIALQIHYADFMNFDSLFKEIDSCRKYIAACEGISPDAPLLEIRIPFNFPHPSYFDGSDPKKSPLISRHNYSFIACLGSSNWSVIFGNWNHGSLYANFPSVEPFLLEGTRQNVQHDNGKSADRYYRGGYESYVTGGQPAGAGRTESLTQELRESDAETEREFQKRDAGIVIEIGVTGHCLKCESLVPATEDGRCWVCETTLTKGSKFKIINVLD